MSKKIAVTGAFGYSGKFITKKLLEKGHSVITLSNSSKQSSPFGDLVEIYPYRFDNKSIMAKSLEGVDVLYNTYWIRFNYDNSGSDPVKNSIALFEAAKEAGVKRIVHISVANASVESKHGYFSQKGHVENILKSTGIPYSILRPAVLFGNGDVLINNIAWAIRNFPMYPIFGNGNYKLQPIFVEDLAKIAVDEIESSENKVIPAIGPETFTYNELITLINSTLNKKRIILHMPAILGVIGTWIIGKYKQDVFTTKSEIDSLMDNMLFTKDATPVGTTYLSKYLEEHKETIGLNYANEKQKRTKR